MGEYHKGCGYSDNAGSKYCAECKEFSTSFFRQRRNEDGFIIILDDFINHINIVHKHDVPIEPRLDDVNLAKPKLDRFIKKPK